MHAIKLKILETAMAIFLISSKISVYYHNSYFFLLFSRKVHQENEASMLLLKMGQMRAKLPAFAPKNPQTMCEELVT